MKVDDFKIDDSRLDRLPMFPLPAVHLFPGTLLPLHVFEPRYCDLVETCLERLSASNANIIVTGLPIERMEKLHAWFYRLFTGVCFPTCAVPNFDTLREIDTVG